MCCFRDYNTSGVANECETVAIIWMAFRATAFKKCISKTSYETEFPQPWHENPFILGYAASELKVMTAEGSSSN